MATNPFEVTIPEGFIGIEKKDEDKIYDVKPNVEALSKKSKEDEVKKQTVLESAPAGAEVTDVTLPSTQEADLLSEMETTIGGTPVTDIEAITSGTATPLMASQKSKGTIFDNINNNNYDNYTQNVSTTSPKLKSLDISGFKEELKTSGMGPLLSAVTGGPFGAVTAFIPLIGYGIKQNKQRNEFLKEFGEKGFSEEILTKEYEWAGKANKTGSQFLNHVLADSFNPGYALKYNAYGGKNFDGNHHDALQKFIKDGVNEGFFNQDSILKFASQRYATKAGSDNYWKATAAQKALKDLGFQIKGRRAIDSAGNEYLDGNLVKAATQAPITPPTQPTDTGVEQPPRIKFEQAQDSQTGQTTGPAGGGFIPTPTPRTGPDLTLRQEGGPIPADNLELVNEPQKDMSGVADDVPRNLDEGDFVINAPAVMQAGRGDIEKMINNAVTELQRKGIKLDFGQTAEDIDKAINTLVSNGEVIIPKALAEQIGYDRLEKINNRGKEKVKELDAQQEQMAQQSPTMQQPIMAQLGGAVGNIPNPYEQQNGFMGIAEQMPTSKFLTQTQVGQNIMQPTQQMQEGGNKIQVKKKPSITQLELVRNSLNSQNDIASLRPEAIAGILGNIAVETGDTFDYRTQQRGGPGQGLFQFEGGHLRAYEEYKRKNKLQPSINAQVRYMLDNIYNGIGFDLGFKNRKDLQKALEEGTTEQVADTFAKLFENPRDETAQYDKRIQRAKEIYDNLFRPSPQKSFKLSQTKEQAMQDIDTMEPVYDTGMMAQQ